MIRSATLLRFPEVLVVREGVAPRRLRTTRTLVATYGDRVPPELRPARSVPHFGWVWLFSAAWFPPTPPSEN
ncbi:MAG: hypothetical protein QME96_11965, partial [Myxococcota bacterium]|nr:hypothetical protein [Myxococcota bacterium]